MWVLRIWIHVTTRNQNSWQQIHYCFLDILILNSFKMLCLIQMFNMCYLKWRQEKQGIVFIFIIVINASEAVIIQSFFSVLFDNKFVIICFFPLWANLLLKCMLVPMEWTNYYNIGKYLQVPELACLKPWNNVQNCWSPTLLHFLRIWRVVKKGQEETLKWSPDNRFLHPDLCCASWIQDSSVLEGFHILELRRSWIVLLRFLCVC